MLVWPFVFRCEFASSSDVTLFFATVGGAKTPKPGPASWRSRFIATLIADNFSSVKVSARAMTGSTLTLAESRLMTRMSAGLIMRSRDESESGVASRVLCGGVSVDCDDVRGREEDRGGGTIADLNEAGSIK